MHLIGGYLITAGVIAAARAAGVPAIVTLTDFWFLCPRITLVRSDGCLCTVPEDPLACVRCCSMNDGAIACWIERVAA